MSHVPVLLNEAVEGLDIKPSDIVIDATLGAGGHSSEIIRRYGDSISLVGFDLDADALVLAQKSVADAGGKLIPIHANFRTMREACMEHGVSHAERVLFDLGISSMEIGESGRGFSFRYDEPLLMTLTNPITAETLTARDVVNEMPEKELADTIYKYGEEKFSRQIAKAVCFARKRQSIETTFELVDIITDAVPGFYKKGRINPATKTFQALRIYVNDEMGATEDGIKGAWNILSSGGRIAVITFHSLEDRLVKNLFKELVKDGGKLVIKKPITPSRKEVLENPRSRSAKLRIIQKL